MKTKQFSAILLAVVCGVSASCSKKPQAQQQAQGAAPTYKTMKVAASSQTIPQTYAASIKGKQDIEIYPQVAGTLTKLCVSEGQVVKKGQTLFIIDQVPYNAALATAQANVKAAQASVATAKLTVESKQTLFDQNVVSNFDLQTAKNALASAQAQLAQARAQEVNARNNLSYTVVKSPSDGVVGTLPYRQGALVSSAIQQPLTVVSDNTQMYVYFSIDENQMLDFTEKYGSMDKAIAAMPPVKLQLNNGQEYGQEGRIESISGVVDQQTGAATVRAVFPNPGRTLHSGSSGSVVIPHTYENCIVIPQTATVQVQDKISVFKVVNGKTSSALITVSPFNDGKNYVVTDGLKVGEVIIAEGAGMVREGMDVK